MRQERHYSKEKSENTTIIHYFDECVIRYLGDTY